MLSVWWIDSHIAKLLMVYSRKLLIGVLLGRLKKQKLREGVIDAGDDEEARRVREAEAEAAAAAAVKRAEESGAALATAKMNKSLHEERSKRLRAETVAEQQRNLIMELQHRVHDIAESNQQLRETVSKTEMVPASPRQQKRLEKLLISAVGTDLEPVAAVGAKPPAAKQPEEGITRHSHVEGAIVSTVTIATASAGTKRIEIESTEGFKRGMHLLIGQGIHSEAALVAAVGSLVLREPLMGDFPKGTRVCGFASNPKGLIALNRAVTKEFVVEILTEEFLPALLQVCIDRDSLHRVDRVYATRNVHRYIYSLRPLPSTDIPAQPPVGVTGGPLGSVTTDDHRDSSTMVRSTPNLMEGRDGCAALMSASETGSTMVVTTPGTGNPLIIRTELTPCDLVHVYEDCLRHRRFSGLGNDEDMGTNCIHVDTFLACIERNHILRNVFEEIARQKSLENVAALVALNVSGDTGASNGGSGQSNVQMTWSMYCRMIRPFCGGGGMNSDVDEALGVDTPQDVGPSSSLLKRLFDIYDCDGDGSLVENEMANLFVDIDGVMFDPSMLTDAIAAVAGRYAADLKFNYKAFVEVRQLYARSTGTMLEGCLLGGIAQVKGAAAVLCAPSDRGGGVSSYVAFLTHLASALPAPTLDAQWLLSPSGGKSLRDILLEGAYGGSADKDNDMDGENMTGAPIMGTISDDERHALFLSKVLEQCRSTVFCGFQCRTRALLFLPQNVQATTDNIPAENMRNDRTSAPESNPETTPCRIFVVQAVANVGLGVVYCVRSDGVIIVVDSETGEVKYEQR